jgi:hypothetical protein
MGRLIREYKQSSDARWYAGEVKSDLIGKGASKRSDFEATDTSKGVCFGLSIFWIIKSAKNEDFWSWMPGPGPHVTEIKTLFRSQRGEYDHTRFEAAGEKIKSQAGLEQQCAVLMNQGTKFKHQGYYYISLRGKFSNGVDDSGHAIAAYLSNDKPCRYFDPNHGEYEADSILDLLEDLKLLIKGYRIKDLVIYWCCWN